MKKMPLQSTEQQLFGDLRRLIDETRRNTGQLVNSQLTILYWSIGKRISEEILKHERAEYGKQIVVSVSRQLEQEYGRGFAEKNVRRTVQFYQVFPDFEYVVSLIRQLSWTHFIALIPITNDLQRNFYAQMSRIENWSVRTLRQKIDSMLFERTAISKKPEELAKLELQQLTDHDTLTPDLVFRDPYILDFLNLKDTYSEKDLERAILRELEAFILELGNGFSFVERQKRMVIDHEDFWLDLLFYHRRLKRLVAIDLKIGKFKAAYKGQMELYLRWLEQYEMQPGEEKPIGLILCAQGNHEQIELLQLDAQNIKVAEYMTELLPPELLKQKLHQFAASSQKWIAHQKATDENETNNT